ncbi:hypothetical protein [Rhizobium leguminosarum]|uniref:hypothetical protein n=1 Tax=Rhizobium leguminosarum TaxID=384 RepID=UPI001FD9EF02|nr:hypothetical protein [Rhizobium leguminosarum]
MVTISGRKRIEFLRQDLHFRVKLRKQAGRLARRRQRFDPLQNAAANGKDAVRVEIAETLEQLGTQALSARQHFAVDKGEFAFGKPAMLCLEAGAKAHDVVEMMVVEIGPVNDVQRRRRKRCRSIGVDLQKRLDAAGNAPANFAGRKNARCVAFGCRGLRRTKQDSRFSGRPGRSGNLRRCAFRKKHLWQPARLLFRWSICLAACQVRLPFSRNRLE